jgi:hypothetical protein
MTALLEHWGYLGIFLAVVLGNMGVPIPEESALMLAGYAASRGVLRLPLVEAHPVQPPNPEPGSGVAATVTGVFGGKS